MLGKTRLRITINSTRKGRKMPSFLKQAFIYSTPMYQALRSEVLKKTDKNLCSHGAYIPMGDRHKIHCMLYGGNSSEEKE